MPTSQVEIASEFMENYRYGTPFVNDTQIAMAGGAGDALTVFSIASNGHLYVVSPDAASDTGWAAVDYNAMVSDAFGGVLKRFDVTTDSSGAPYLAAVVATAGEPDSDSLYLVEDFSPAPELDRWIFCGRTSKTSIAALSLKVLDGKAPVAVMTTIDNATGASSLQWVALAPAQTPAPWSAVETTAAMATPLAAVVANRSGQQQLITSYLDAGGSAHLDSTPVAGGPATSIDTSRAYTRLALAAGAAGDDVLFAAAGADLFFQDPNLGLTALGSAPAAVGQLAAVRDMADTYDVFALTADSRLFHAVQGRQDPEEILQHVAHVAAADSTDGTQALCYVGLDNTLHMASIDRQTGDWRNEQVDVAVDRTVETIKAFSTVLTFSDAALAPALFENVQITSSALTGVYLNGEAYALDSTTPLSAMTNAAGQIVLTTTTDSLATATFSVTADFLPGDHSIELRQNADVQGQLRTVTSDELLKATRSDGSLLLQGQYATPDVAAALQQAVNNAMSLAEPPPAPSGGQPVALRNVQTRAGIHHPGPVQRLGALHHASIPIQHWELDMTAGVPAYREHTAASIAPRFSGSAASSSWSWGDLWDAVESGVIELGKLFVSTVLDPAKQFVQQVIAKIEDFAGNVLWEGAVSLLEQAFDIAEGVFNTVKVFFEDLFEWLAFLFDWDDILRTKAAIEHSLEQFIPFIQTAVEAVKNQAVGYIDTLKGDIEEYFQAAITNLGGTTILGKQQADQQPDDSVRATAPHNIVFSGFINNATSAPPVSGGATPPLAESVLGSLESLITTLGTYAEQWESVQAFENAFTYFGQIGDNPDRFLELALSGLLSIAEGIALLALDTVGTIVGLIFDGVNAVLGGVLALLRAPWDIPWVSDLYAQVTGGSTLCTLDLLSLIIAIPGTVLYKVIYKAAPFPADTDVAAFAAAFTTQSLVSASGLAPARTARFMRDAAPAAATPSPYQGVFQVLWCVNQFFYGAIEAIVDVIPPDPVPGGFQIAGLNPKFRNAYNQFGDGIGALSVATWVMEWTSQLFSLPWIAGDGGGVGCSDDTDLGNMIWVLHNIGAGYDTVWYFVSQFTAGGRGRIARNAGDIGVLVDSAYGVVDLGLQFWWACANGWEDDVVISQNFFATLPEMAKLGRHTKVITETVGWSLPAVSACDLIGDWTAMGLGVANAMRTANKSSRRQASQLALH